MIDRAVLPDMRAVTAFVEIIRTGSLTFTAEKLAIPKSTLSRRISQLEQRVGQQLLRRESNRLIPTQAGQIFAEYCQQFIDLAQQSQLALDALQLEVSGTLDFTFHNAFNCRWLSEKGLGLYPNWLAELSISQQNVKLQRCLEDWHGPSLPVWLMYPYGHLSRRTRVFIDHLKSEPPATWKY